MPESEVATFGGGCFWCTEAVFQKLAGVSQVVSGYAAGEDPNPTYEQVCQGTTGHAEVIQVTFDPGRISYADLLQVFFATHDPTTLNRQGNDRGTQYRSIILFHSDAQRVAAESTIEELNGSGEFADPIVTTVEPLDVFHSAEAYHQDFYRQNPHQPYCNLVIPPKLDKLAKRFADRLR